jgi:hypothetical protein
VELRVYVDQQRWNRWKYMEPLGGLWNIEGHKELLRSSGTIGIMLNSGMWNSCGYMEQLGYEEQLGT